MNKTVILIHGLYMNHLSMKILEYKFKREGFNVLTFNYKTIRFDKDETLRNLHKMVENINSDIYLVGHSMGGLISRLYKTEFNSINVKKIVTLGTPHNGSHVAKFINGTKLRGLLGNSGESGIIKQLPDWESQCEMGCIIGIGDFGLNLIFGKVHGKHGDNDGTVFVDEASVNCPTDKIIMKVSHLGMLSSNSVFKESLSFINNSKFSKFN
ncbi:alpha/beta hydrolase [archaeon]|nr:alpha/beta hydrolase [archaeon]